MKLIRYNEQVFFLINQTDASCCNYHPSFSISRPLTPSADIGSGQSLLAEPSRQCKCLPALAVRALIHPRIPPILSHPSPGPSQAFIRRTPFPSSWSGAAPGAGVLQGLKQRPSCAPVSACQHLPGAEPPPWKHLPGGRPGPEGGGQGHSRAHTWVRSWREGGEQGL